MRGAGRDAKEGMRCLALPYLYLPTQLTQPTQPVQPAEVTVSENANCHWPRRHISDMACGRSVVPRRVPRQTPACGRAGRPPSCLVPAYQRSPPGATEQRFELNARRRSILGAWRHGAGPTRREESGDAVVPRATAMVHLGPIDPLSRCAAQPPISTGRDINSRAFILCHGRRNLMCVCGEFATFRGRIETKAI